jgi:hypothetical protein
MFQAPITGILKCSLVSVYTMGNIILHVCTWGGHFYSISSVYNNTTCLYGYHMNILTVYLHKIVKQLETILLY